jgi:N,N'-diacetylchitobiose transport system substrate-binding protein
MHRKLRTAVVTGVAATLFAAAAGCGGDDSSDNSSGGNGGGSQAKDITVWLMNGSAPDSVIKKVNDEFTAAHPGTTVNIEIKQWDGIQEATTTALAGNNPPDVLEIGSTLVSKFADSGGLEDLTDKKGELGGDSWLQGLTDAGTLDGKLYGIPYYAGDRAVLYRKDLLAKAGVTTLPTDRASFVAAAAKLQAKYGSDKKFSALYFPGQYWYAALPFVWDEGGDVAVKDGDQWKGALDSPQSQAGLTWLKDVVNKYSKAPVNGNENDNDPAVPLGEGKAAMIIDAGWKVGTVIKNKPALKDQIGVFPIPGKTAGQTAPVFLGGSNLSISAGSDAPDLAYDWIKILAGEKAQTDLATTGGVIPNSTSLLTLHAKDPILSVFDTAAKNSRSTPSTPKWANVESSTILQDMLVAIFSGSKSIPDATKAASDAITKTLNA